MRRLRENFIGSRLKGASMADLGKTVRTVRVTEPVKAPDIGPAVSPQPVETPVREYEPVPVR